MTKKKNLAKDIISQALVSVKNLSAFWRTESHDKRTIKGTKTALKELQGKRKDKEVAADLGISRQRYTALKNQINKGKAYSPELRDILKDTTAERKEALEPERLKEGVYVFPSLETLQDTGTKVEVIKSFTSKKDARSWWKNIVNSGKYVGIAKQSNGLWSVVAFGERKQRPKTIKTRNSKGQYTSERIIEDMHGRNRVSEIMDKYRDITGV